MPEGGDTSENDQGGRGVPRDRPSEASEAATAFRLAGAGLELAGSTLLLGGVGYLADLWRGHVTPYAAIVGLLVGFAAGLFRLIRLAEQMAASEEKRRER